MFFDVQLSYYFQCPLNNNILIIENITSEAKNDLSGELLLMRRSELKEMEFW
jgi:hypothetical protein